MSLELLKHCLDADFWQENHTEITEDYFSSDLRKLYSCLKEHYQTTQHSVSEADLYTIYCAKYPVATASDKKNVETVINNLKAVDTSPETAKTIIKIEKRKSLAAKLASEFLDIADGKTEDFSKAESLFQELNKSDQTVEDKYVLLPSDVVTLLDMGKISSRWKWPLEPFRRRAKGVGPGVFTIIGATPNCGKTAFTLSLMLHPEGFANQGAKCLYIGNEEFASRTLARGIACYTGKCMDDFLNEIPMQEREKYEENELLPEDSRLALGELLKELPTLAGKLEEQNQIFSKVSSKIIAPANPQGLTMKDLEELVSLHKPDVVIIDQLDKLKVEGKFDSDYLKYAKLYLDARELAKTHMCAVFAVSQLSAEAQGKKYPSYDLLKGSKTDKAAEADFIITIGCERSEGEDNGFRVANFCKAKLTGNEGHDSFMLNKKLSRIEV